MANKTEDQLDEFEQDNAFDEKLPTESRLESLKRKATLLGIKFRDNISEATLAERIAKHQEGLSSQDPDEPEEDIEDEEEQEEPQEEVEPQGRMYTEEEVRLLLAAQGERTRVSHPKQKGLTPRQRSMFLYRVIIRPVDPRRIQLDGEFITAGNSILGTTSKYIPFNAEQGYHVPSILLNSIKDRTFTEFYTVEDKFGNEKTLSRQRNAYIIEYLPPLTQAELDEIRARQRGNMDD